MIKPIKNLVIVSAVERNDEIRVDKRFDPLLWNERYGEIIETSFEYTILNDLKKGDKIYMHYLVAQDKNRLIIDDQELFITSINNIFAKIENGKLIPCQDVVFCEQIIDDNLYDGGLQIKNNPAPISQLLKVVATNDFGNKMGIFEGDLILTIAGAGSEVMKTDLKWIKLLNIIGKVVDDEIIPLNGMCVIEEGEIEQTWAGLMVSEIHWSRFGVGKVLKSTIGYEGENVTYIHTMHSRLSFKGKTYCMAEERNLIFRN